MKVWARVLIVGALFWFMGLGEGSRGGGHLDGDCSSPVGDDLDERSVGDARSEQLQGGGQEVGSLTVLEADQLWWWRSVRSGLDNRVTSLTWGGGQVNRKDGEFGRRWASVRCSMVRPAGDV